jgi:hypothetical protein
MDDCGERGRSRWGRTRVAVAAGWATLSLGVAALGVTPAAAAPLVTAQSGVTAPVGATGSSGVTATGVRAGGVLPFGGAANLGSPAGTTLAAPIIGIAATPSGHGYWLVASDGGVFSYGDAGFYGSAGSLHLNRPIVGMAATPNGRGYWLVASDGGIFAFGDAGFYGSAGSYTLNKPIVGMAASKDGGGYWLVASDGGIFTYGDAPFEGSASGQDLALPVVGMASSGTGYWLAEGGGAPGPFDTALINYLKSLPETVTASVEDLNTGQLYNFNAGPSLVLGSTVKVQILGTALAEAQATGGGLTAQEQALAVPMIEISDNADAQALFNLIGGAPAVQAWDDSIGLTGTFVYTDWGVSTSTGPDQITLLNTFVQPNRFLTNASRAYGLYLLGHVETSQIFGVNVGPAPGTVLAAKTGRIPGVGAINDIGWVKGDGRDYLMVVLVQGAPSDQDGLAAMEVVSYDAWNTLAP